MDKFQRLNQIRESYLALKGRQVTPNKERQRQITAVRNTATKLRGLLPTLPREHLFDINKDGTEDDTLLDRILDDLTALEHALDRIDLHDSGRVQGWAEDNLVRQLAAMEPKETCYWDPVAESYSGGMVQWFEAALTYMELELDPKIVAQAMAQRCMKQKKE